MKILKMLVLGMITLLVVGCGGGGGDSPPTSQPNLSDNPVVTQQNNLGVASFGNAVFE